MGNITLRGLSDETIKRLKREARSAGLSMNRYVVRKLEGTGPGSREYHDLDHLFGTMDQEDGRILDESIAEQRQIDEDMWR